MPYIERTDDEIIFAWEQHVVHLETIHGYDISVDVVFSIGGERFTLKKFVEALRIRDNPDLFGIFVDLVRKDGREKDRDPIEHLRSCRIPPCVQ